MGNRLVTLRPRGFRRGGVFLLGGAGIPRGAWIARVPGCAGIAGIACSARIARVPCRARIARVSRCAGIAWIVRSARICGCAGVSRRTGAAGADRGAGIAWPAGHAGGEPASRDDAQLDAGRQGPGHAQRGDDGHDDGFQRIALRGRIAAAATLRFLLHPTLSIPSLLSRPLPACYGCESSRAKPPPQIRRMRYRWRVAARTVLRLPFPAAAIIIARYNRQHCREAAA